MAELIHGFPISCARPEVEISGLTHDSRQVEPGYLFAALPGRRTDGRRFAGEAVERGAVAVMGPGTRPGGLEVDWLSVENPRYWLGPLAARLHGHPDREMTTVGVTGTNGKTTVTALVAAILDAAGRPCARLGTLGHALGSTAWTTERTTPEAPELFALLRRLRTAGAEAAVLEVSSHALDLHRVRGLGFDVAVFTNLSRDHLDFHGDMEEYFAAKKTLFDGLGDGARSVVNVDDRFGRRLAGGLESPVTFGSDGIVQIVDSELDERGIRLVAATPRGRVRLDSALRGRFNIENLAAAVAVAEALDLPHEAVVAGVALTRPLNGRLEPVELGQPFPVFIDYAHTEQALVAALEALREMCGRRLIVVFGCGGDRDPGKREPMGVAAGRLADLAIVTSDNPRSEDPNAIIAAVERGVRRGGKGEHIVIEDRRAAIREAVRRADGSSVVLVAGKGHESEQILADRTVRFSDREEVEAALEERFGGRHVG